MKPFALSMDLISMVGRSSSTRLVLVKAAVVAAVAVAEAATVAVAAVAAAATVVADETDTKKRDDSVSTAVPRVNLHQ